MKGPKLSSQSLIKEQNKKKIIRALWDNSPISRTGLAKLTGLNKGTITNLINEIDKEKMIINVGQQKSTVGRSSNLIMFNENYGLCAGIVIRPKVINLALSDVFTKILWEYDFEYSPQDKPLAVLEKISVLLTEQINKYKDSFNNFLGIGIGTGSLLRQADDMMYAVHSISWFDVPLGEYFRQRFKVPILVDTVSNNAMIGEKYFGAAKDVSNAVFLNIGNGIGGGLLLNNQLYRGANGFAGDLGHFIIDPNGPNCPCGNVGCWEVMGSTLAIENGSLKELVEKAEKGDTAAITLLDRMGHALGLGISNLVRTLNPELVILGGDIVIADKWIMNPCKVALKTRLWPFVWKQTNIQFARLGSRSAIIGSLTRIIELMFT